MPRTKINYQKTVIYKIVCRDLKIKDLFVGCTTDFKRRKSEHKNMTTYNLKKVINENGGWENWDMIEVEKFSCNDGNEAKARQRFWMEQLNANLNFCKPILTQDEKDNYLYNRKQDIITKFNDVDINNWFELNHIRTDNKKDILNVKELFQNFKEENNITHMTYKFFYKKMENLITLNNNSTKQIKYYKLIQI